MRIVHNGGFPDEERYQTRAIIFSNILKAFKVLLDIMKTESIGFAHERSKVNNAITPRLCAETARHEAENLPHRNWQHY